MRGVKTRRYENVSLKKPCNDLDVDRDKNLQILAKC